MESPVVWYSKSSYLLDAPVVATSVGVRWRPVASGGVHVVPLGAHAERDGSARRPAWKEIQYEMKMPFGSCREGNKVKQP